MTKAIRNVNEKISEALIGMDPIHQSQIDHAMIGLDKTEKKVIYIFLYQLRSTICLCSRWVPFIHILFRVYTAFKSSELLCVFFSFHFISFYRANLEQMLY